MRSEELGDGGRNTWTGGYLVSDLTLSRQPRSYSNFVIMFSSAASSHFLLPFVLYTVCHSFVFALVGKRRTVSTTVQYSTVQYSTTVDTFFAPIFSIGNFKASNKLYIW